MNFDITSTIIWNIKECSHLSTNIIIFINSCNKHGYKYTHTNIRIFSLKSWLLFWGIDLEGVRGAFNQQQWSFLLLCQIFCHNKSLTPSKSLLQKSNHDFKENILIFLWIHSNQNRFFVRQRFRIRVRHKITYNLVKSKKRS